LADWCEGRGITRVVHTRHHEDHCGADAELTHRFGVEVFAPPRTVPILERFYRLPWYRRMVWGQPRDVVSRPYGGEVEIGGYGFLAIPTPGHAQDHNCLFEPERRWLFSGDLFINERVAYLRRSEDAETILGSLRRISALEPGLVICSHAGFIDDPPGAIQARIRFWEDLTRRAKTMAASGTNPRAISRKLLGSEGWMTRLSCGDFSKTNLIRALLRSGGEDQCALV